MLFRAKFIQALRRAEDAAEFLQRVARIDALRCQHRAMGRWRTLATLQSANAAKAQGQALCTGPP